MGKCVKKFFKTKLFNLTTPLLWFKIDVLFTQPFAKVKHLTDTNIYAENTARDYLNKLCEMQILEKKELGGHHYYLNLELYRIPAE